MQTRLEEDKHRKLHLGDIQTLLKRTRVCALHSGCRAQWTHWPLCCQHPQKATRHPEFQDGRTHLLPEQLLEDLRG